MMIFMKPSRDGLSWSGQFSVQSERAILFPDPSVSSLTLTILTGHAANSMQTLTASSLDFGDSPSKVPSLAETLNRDRLSPRLYKSSFPC